MEIPAKPRSNIVSMAKQGIGYVFSGLYLGSRKQASPTHKNSKGEPTVQTIHKFQHPETGTIEFYGHADLDDRLGNTDHVKPGEDWLTVTYMGMGMRPTGKAGHIYKVVKPDNAPQVVKVVKKKAVIPGPVAEVAEVVGNEDEEAPF